MPEDEDEWERWTAELSARVRSDLARASVRDGAEAPPDMPILFSDEERGSVTPEAFVAGARSLQAV